MRQHCRSVIVLVSSFAVAWPSKFPSNIMKVGQRSGASCSLLIPLCSPLFASHYFYRNPCRALPFSVAVCPAERPAAVSLCCLATGQLIVSLGLDRERQPSLYRDELAIM
jgi:hypothetical protein